MNTKVETQTNIIAQLKHHGLRRTAFREDILGIFNQEHGRALSSSDVESFLDDGYDRITLYRTLKSFEEHGIIHQLIDINGNSKYAICGHQCDKGHHEDTHAHFHCNSCGQTQCLYDSLKTLTYSTPDGFQVEEARVLLSGTCMSCS